MATGPDYAAQGVVTLLDRVRMLRRRRGTIIAAAVLMPLAAVLYSLAQQPLYLGSASVLVNQQNVAASILGTPANPTEASQPERIIATQASIARSPAIASIVIHGSRSLHISRVRGAHLGTRQFLNDSSVSADPTADLLTFSVKSPSPGLARHLANTYALSYVAWRQLLDSQPYQAAHLTLGKRGQHLGCTPRSTSVTCADLQKSLTQLRTLQAVQKGNTTLTTPAVTASKVQPLTTRNAVIGVLAGLLLGILLAYVREALDTRVRSEDEILQALGMPILGRLRTPGRSLRRHSKLILIEHAKSTQAEEFRSLRTNIDFANLPLHARSIMIVSGRESEGKSTVISNLAVAFAEVGRSVVLVDLDLRKPCIHRFFGLDARPGFSDLVVGDAALEDTVQPVDIIPAAHTSSDPVRVGKLDAITSGSFSPDPARLLALDVLGDVVRELRARYDIVLIDTPPVLAVSDAMIISANVDAMLVVAHRELSRRDTLLELGRVVSIGTTPGLGIVLTAAEAGSHGGYGYGHYGYGSHKSLEPASSNGSWRARIRV
jgi:capsular exopolysaccharide synthesis family protein